MSSITGSSLGLDAIGEFQMLTNTFTAQFGGNGAVVNAVTKSGTNSFHGTAFEFLRNTDLNARNTFATTNPPLHRNQFGGSLGGPVKKDKAFFFVNYEGVKQGARGSLHRIRAQLRPAESLYSDDNQCSSRPSDTQRAGDLPHAQPRDCQSRHWNRNEPANRESADHRKLRCGPG